MTNGQKTPKTASNRSKSCQIGFFGKNNPKYVFLKQFDNLQRLNAQIRFFEHLDCKVDFCDKKTFFQNEFMENMFLVSILAE